MGASINSLDCGRDAVFQEQQHRFESSGLPGRRCRGVDLLTFYQRHACFKQPAHSDQAVVVTVVTRRAVFIDSSTSVLFAISPVPL